jgi:signal transduction histidine kinase
VSNSDYLAALGYVYLGQIVAFAFCQLLLLQPSNRVHIFYWQLASGFSALSILGAPHILTVFSTQDLAEWAAFSSLVGGVFRYVAISFGAKGLTRDPWSKALVIAAVVGMPFALAPSLLDYRLLIASAVGVAISAACFLGLLRNRYWANENELGRRIVLVGMAISIVALVARGLTSYPLGEDRLFVGVSMLQIRATELLVVMSIFLQIGFFGMLVSRRDKEAKFADRRNVRLWQRSAILAQRGRNLRELAKQRLDLIQLLTHEVRQPINNAQASLQSITPDLDKLPLISDRANYALDRAKGSLDGITRALSNVIVASTLVADDQNWFRQQIDAMEVLEMARLDCSDANQKRIVVAPPDHNIFIECVPTLLRVALHNLLEHALSVADVGENISVSVTADGVKLGVLFTISGNMSLQKMDAMDGSRDCGMVSRASPQMTNSGLFVANLIAQNHLGECSIETGNPDITKILFFVRQ